MSEEKTEVQDHLELDEVNMMLKLKKQNRVLSSVFIKKDISPRQYSGLAALMLRTIQAYSI